MCHKDLLALPALVVLVAAMIFAPWYVKIGAGVICLSGIVFFVVQLFNDSNTDIGGHTR